MSFSGLPPSVCVCKGGRPGNEANSYWPEHVDRSNSLIHTIQERRGIFTLLYVR